MQCAESCVQTGLSPPVRGNPPAYDGQLGIDEVYPRPCGGTNSWGAAANQYDGLSPPVRGNRPDSGARHADHGSIPARAGEPLRTRVRPIRTPVYPRPCGGTLWTREPMALA